MRARSHEHVSTDAHDPLHLPLRSRPSAVAGPARHNGWPPIIESEISIADAEAGTIQQHVRAGSAKATSKLQVVAIDGDVYRVQRLDDLQVSRWRLDGEQLICGERPLETVLVFRRRP